LCTPQSREASGKRCLASQKSRPQGLATLPAASAPPDPWKPLSASDARGLRPSELRSSPAIGKKVSLPLLPPRLFPAKPSRPGSGALGGLIPPKKPCPLLLPWVLTPGRGLVLSWASRPFGLSRPKNPRRGFSPRTSPLPFFPPNGLAAARERNLRGFRLFRPGISLRRGRRPVWPFPPTALRYPLGSPPAAGYFFTSGTQAPSRELRWPS
jgi:hypothetical protein